MRRITTFLSLILLLLWSSIVVHGQTVYNQPPKRILLLHNYGREIPGVVLFEQGFENVLRGVQPGSVELYRETLEAYRFPGEAHAQFVRNYLKQKYDGRKIDVVIAYTGTALEFITKYRAELFPGVPLVYVVSRRPEPGTEPPLSTGVWVGPNIKETLELALQLQPLTQQVFVINGPLNQNHMMEEEVKKQLREFENRVRLHYITARPLEEVITDVASLPEHSIVLCQRQTKGLAGRNIVPRDAVSLIAQAANAPVYGTFDTWIGEGIVGGQVMSHVDLGTRTAELALNVASGTPPGEIPIETIAMRPMFDWRQLNKWGISESALPAGSLVRFKQSTLWEQYKWRIIVMVSLLIIQSLLIVYLLLNRARRMRAEVERERFALLAREEHRHLEQVISNVPGIVWETRFQPDGTMSDLFLSQQIEKLLGYSLYDWQADPKFWLALMPAEDREPTLRQVNAIFESREDGVVQFRWQANDGRLLWIESNLSVTFDENDSAIGLRGVSLDITARKAAETALHHALNELGELKEQLQQENLYLQEEIRREHNFEEIVGNSDELKYVLFMVEKVAPTDSVVLIQGETGTGKELIARAIHGSSKRNNRPMVKINCAALPATLIESELFGHEKGAFTGAQGRKIGRFELADGATLFLDEIGELPLELQPKLLRVLQEGEFERLGGTKTTRVDVRIIAATNRDLQSEVQKGLFRSDLWYRLNVYPITVPPLRDRRGDIPLLANTFIKQFSKKLNRPINAIDPGTLTELERYRWPGNIRELRNTIERALINTQGPVLKLVDKLDASADNDVVPVIGKSLEQLEREIIIQRLEETNWRISGPRGAAESLGLHPNTLRARMTKLDIRKAYSRTRRGSEEGRVQPVISNRRFRSIPEMRTKATVEEVDKDVLM
jgi:formate hydrogenlyase transcriptional activator